MDIPGTCRRTAAAAALFLFLAPGAAAQEGLAGLDAEIAQMIRDWGIPGAAVVVVQDDEITFAEGFGREGARRTDPVDENTIFAVGSTSKAFTAAAVAMLVDEGKVAWDDAMVDHVPIFRLSDPYITRDLRVRDLMSHNSGLMRGDRLWYASGRSREEVLKQVRHQPVTFPLRSTFQYNNTTWIAAGEVIENATGMSWDDFVASRIFAPLGMTRSTTSVADLDRLDNVATPHNPSLDGEVTAVPYRDIDNAGPAGSINSSALQMASGSACSSAWVNSRESGSSRRKPFARRTPARCSSASRARGRSCGPNRTS